MKDSIKLVSCDIFDTLFFRSVNKPESVFGKMYERNPELFGSDITANGWQNLRINVEKLTRRNKQKKQGIQDITINELYENIGKILPNASEIMKCEFETERALGILNSEIWQFLESCHDQNRKVILTSDMYWPKEKIIELLNSAGAKLEIIDEIFVSCDYGMTKRSGDLFRHILDRYKLMPDEVLHIGDNYASDIGAAKFIGINTLYYPLISEVSYRLPELDIEKIYYTENTGTLQLVRTFATRYYKGEDFFWERLGASCLGPALTGFAEWVVDYAYSNNFKNIYPMMREGAFLGKLISRASTEMGKPLNIHKFYVSRYALTLHSTRSISRENIEYQVLTHGITVGDVFDNLSISEAMGPFFKYKDIQTSKLNQAANSDGSPELAIDGLIEYLTTPEMLSMIRERNNEKGDILKKYLGQIGLLDGGLTIDVGWKGSLQGMLEEFLEAQGIEIRTDNLLFASSDGAPENLIKGCKIRGYFGNLCDDAVGIKQFYPRLMELFLGCEEGTTTGYEWDGDMVVPKMLQINYPQEQKNKIKRVQIGIEQYQNCFYDSLKWIKETKTKADYEYLLRLMKDTVAEQKQILIRLFSAPLKQEAENLSGLLYDQNFGGNRFEPILNQDILVMRERKSGRDFWKQSLTTQFQWYCGMCVLNDGLIFYKQKNLDKTQFRFLHFIAMLEDFLEKCAGRAFVLVGAGKNLAYFLQYCYALGVGNQIAGILDNDAKKRNASIMEHEIQGMGYDFKTEFFLITTLKEDFIFSLKEDLHKQYGTDIKIGSYL